MPGTHITDRQVRRYMEHRRQGDTQFVARPRPASASAARGALRQPPCCRVNGPEASWSDPAGPFGGRLAERAGADAAGHPHLRATTLLEDLQRRYPERYPDRLLRTLQRRLATWRATEGPEREIIFRQEHPLGEQALSDFTGGKLTGDDRREPFAHLLYHFWLAFSGWQYVKAIQGGKASPR